MNYITIYKSSLSDGEGWRVVLFVSGCDHKCPGCHNPQSWDKNAGKPFTEETKEYLFNAVNNSEIDGLTLSGGDPLYSANIKDVTALCKEFKERFPNKDIWLYTGSVYDDKLAQLEVMQYIDYLVDGPFILEKRDTSQRFRGSTNQRIINIKKRRLKQQNQTN
jgi:anaerobic ribonucleoside-triphosphate reductase activating protein